WGSPATHRPRRRPEAGTARAEGSPPGHEATPRAPARAHLPLLPSSPGGVQQDDTARGVMDQHTGSSTPVPTPAHASLLTTRRPRSASTPLSRPTWDVGATTPSRRSRPCNGSPKVSAEPGLSGKFPPPSGGDPGHAWARRQGCRRFPYPRSIHDRRTHRRRQRADLVPPPHRWPPRRRPLLHHPHRAAPDPEPPRHDRPAEEGRDLPRRHLLLPVA